MGANGGRRKRGGAGWMVLLGWWKLSNGVEAEAVSCGRAADGSELVGGQTKLQTAVPALEHP